MLETTGKCRKESDSEAKKLISPITKINSKINSLLLLLFMLYKGSRPLYFIATLIIFSLTKIKEKLFI